MEIRHHTVHANGIRQHYLDAGQGPPVVLLHGFPETNYAWRHQIPALATRYRVIAPDLRGYGETDKPASGYDKRTMALDLLNCSKNWELARLRWLDTIEARASRRGSPKIIRKRLIVSWSWTMSRPESSHATSIQ
jgi:pimeloyl-ACP methyl ester carboxylesterase